MSYHGITGSNSCWWPFYRPSRSIDLTCCTVYLYHHLRIFCLFYLILIVNVPNKVLLMKPKIPWCDTNSLIISALKGNRFVNLSGSIVPSLDSLPGKYF